MKYFKMTSLCLIIFFLSSCTDKFTNKFDNFELLIQSQLYMNGWISINLPDNIENIEITHDIDTNEVWIQTDFKIPINLENWILIEGTQNQLFSKLLNTFEIDKDASFYKISEKEILIINYDILKIYHYKKNR